MLQILSMALLFISMPFIGYYSYQYFAPKYMEVQHKVFKESTSYNDGMLRDLENLMLEYQNADASHKEAIKAIVIHRFSVYDTNRLPSHLAAFKQSLVRGY
jgi:hypothetical protein